MQKVTLYTGSHCPYCNMAKHMLAQLGVDNITEIDVGSDREAFARMQRETGRRSIPQIFIGDTHVGGFTDMYALHQKGALLPLLGAE